MISDLTIPGHVHMIGLQFTIAAGMIVTTAIAHILMLDLLLKTANRLVVTLKVQFYRSWRIMILVTFMTGVFCSHIFHMWLWAHLYLWIDGTDITTLEQALYFSTTTYTTLGYGDVILHPDWRLLGSTEAFNGMLLLGLSTAALFEVLIRIYGTRGQ